jgi:hypothetical protein
MIRRIKLQSFDLFLDRQIIRSMYTIKNSIFQMAHNI